MKPEDQAAFNDALVNRCQTVVTVPQDFEAGWQSALAHRDAQPAVAVNEQDAKRFEYLEQFTKCIKTPNGDLAWTIQLQQVLVGDTFGKAIDAAIAAAQQGRGE